MMADSEAKHSNVILSMQRNDKTQYSADTEVLTKLRFYHTPTHISPVISL